jgi:HAMP domain-containing protein
VTALTDAARRMEGGDLAVRVDAQSSGDEIGDLAHAFNSMHRGWLRTNACGVRW